MESSRAQFMAPRGTVADAAGDAVMSSADDPLGVVEDVAMAPAGVEPVPPVPTSDQAMVPAGTAPASEGGTNCTALAPWGMPQPSQADALRTTLRSLVPGDEAIREDMESVAEDAGHDIPGIPSAKDLRVAVNHKTGEGMPEHFKVGPKVRLPAWAHALAPGCLLFKKFGRLYVMEYA